MLPKSHIYVDMDGVLVDFLKGVHQATGIHWQSAATKEEKHRRNHAVFETGDNFWRNLPPMPDFNRLWSFVGPYHPDVLTAVPHGVDGEPPSESSQKFAREGKWLWCQMHLHIPFDRFHAVFREHKANFATSEVAGHVVSNILIDDHEQNIKEFIKNRGIGILHTSAEDTISKLKKLGFT